MPSEEVNNFFQYFNRVYMFTDQLTPVPYISSGNIIIYIAVQLSKIVFGKVYFDIRVLGVIQWFIYLEGMTLFYIAIKRITKKRLFVNIIIALLFLTNIGYIVYFNSFYSESGSIIFFLYFVSYGMIVNQKIRENNCKFYELIILSLLGFLFSISKSQNTIIMFFVAIYIIYLIFRCKFKRREQIITITLTLLLSVSSILVLKANSGLEIITKFDSTFYGIFKNSDDPVQALKDFNIDEKYVGAVGNAYFAECVSDTTNDPEFVKQLEDNVNYAKLLGYYLKHPKLLYKAIKISSENALTIEIPYLGNYQYGRGYEPNEKADYWNYTTKFEKALKINSLPGMVIVYSVLIFSLIRLRKKIKNLEITDY